MRARNSRIVPVLVLVAVMGLLASLVTGGAQAGASARVPDAPSTAAPTAASHFLAGFYGHDRGLEVTKKYVVTEYFDTGCCRPVSTYTLQLSKAKYSRSGAPVAHIVVLKTHFDKGAYRFPGVKVGTTGTATVKHGVYEDTVLKATFCTSKGGAGGVCGA